MRIEIHGRDLPDGYEGRGAVGLQRGREVVQRYPLDISAPFWVAEATPHVAADGSVDLRGPYVHGRRGDRFLYLSWGHLEAGGFAMVRRAKLLLDAVDPAVLAQAAEPAGVLVAELGLTGADGTPVCAAVRPPAITWRATQPGTTRRPGPAAVSS